MTYKLVLFDFDGVIYDPQLVADSGNCITIEDVEQYYNNETSFEHLLEPLKPYWAPYEGLLDLIEELPGKKGVVTNGPTIIQHTKLAHTGVDHIVDPELIFVSYEESEKIVDTEDHPYLLEMNPHSSRFEKIQQIESKYIGKPSPFMILQACIRSGCTPEETIMIGDQHTDVTAAKEAGASAVKIEGVSSLLPQNETSPVYTPDFTLHKENIVPSLRDILFKDD